jgi:MYXO-CTERM domain-containing protein
MTANSDQNTFLIPILAGMFDGATITPAPSGWGLLGLGLIVAGRRRR